MFKNNEKVRWYAPFNKALIVILCDKCSSVLLTHKKLQWDRFYYEFTCTSSEGKEEQFRLFNRTVCIYSKTSTLEPII